MFSKSLRPRSRVRAMGAEDLAVVPDHDQITWLIDSRNVVCLLGCGVRIPRGHIDITAEAMRLHRLDCKES